MAKPRNAQTNITSLKGRRDGESAFVFYQNEVPTGRRRYCAFIGFDGSSGNLVAETIFL
jgi:hypothetical protein